MTACADKILLLHALVDGELDAANIITLEQHLKTCSGCRAELERIEALRDLLGVPGLKNATPPGLRSRIERDIARATLPDKSTRTPVYGRAGLIAGGVAALAASFVLGLVTPRATLPGVQDQLVADHVRSLLAEHLTDVTTSDQHLVKPWFNGKIDFSPPVPELADQGFPLAGGRVDYVDNQVVAAIVYHRRLHPINLFVRPAGALSLPFSTTTHRNGYNLVRWTQGGLEFWAVSDLNTKELQQFQQIFATKAAG